MTHTLYLYYFSELLFGYAFACCVVALAVVNTVSAQQDFTLPDSWQQTECTDLLTGETVDAPQSATLSGYEYRIYKRSTLIFLYFSMKSVTYV